MLQLIKPKYFMPIHGEYKMLVQHKETGKETGLADDHIFTCANGDVLILRNHQVFESSWRIQADDIYVDGNDISGVSTAVLKDRTILADNGLVAAIIAIDSKENKVRARHWSRSCITRRIVIQSSSLSLSIPRRQWLPWHRPELPEQPSVRQKRRNRRTHNPRQLNDCLFLWQCTAIYDRIVRNMRCRQW